MWLRIPVQNTVRIKPNHLNTPIAGLFSTHSIVLYQGYLLTQLLQNVQPSPSISSMDDLILMVDSGDAILNLRSPTKYLARQIANNVSSSSYDVYADLRQALRHHPPVYLSVAEAHANQQNNPEQIYVSHTSTLSAISEIATDNCGFSLVVDADSTVTMKAFPWSSAVAEQVIDDVDELIRLHQDCSRVLPVLEGEGT